MQRAMEKINRARVNLKHHGQRPTSDQLHDYLITTKNFLEEACPLCFCIELNEVSMADLIKDQKTRDLLKTAEIELGEAKPHDALISASKAFAWGSRTAWRTIHSPLLAFDFR
jgi:hypothetical protein